ncbi:ROK family protein [Roseibium sp. TrichSKD4]|uniref:ROK family protein n=1 Tax=Roseibium sp. TrichSKD4 TaxID=744980 RepID=UPI0001E5765E|nr:ROK family protein [Roseibium sp. TrichSKD4]EFO30050.1 ROK family protein [Roseibium sp. TrichSKD4]
MTTCFDIGGSYLRFGRRLADGTVPELGRVPTPKADWDAFVSAIQSAAPDAGPISISLAGAFDAISGIADVANIPCLHGRKVASDLAKAIGRPVQVTNDADCFAIAEARLGTGVDKPVVFGLILGTGVGGGLVINNHLVPGYGGISGEWGHGPMVDPTAGGTINGIDPIKCGCGRTGCVDAYGSARGMEKIHFMLHGEDISSLEVTGRWRDKDPNAAKTIDAYTTLLSRPLSAIINTLGPYIVPVSGGLSSDAELLAEIDRKTRARTLARYDYPLVVRGTHAANGGLVGAGLIAQDATMEAA